ncbi:hypothetical protein ACFLXU_07625, partial [Chloroflexota bacterium]
QACNLFYQAFDIWFQSHSLSYAALISCLESLIVFEHRDDHPAPCCTCGSTQYHVMENFRSFLGIDNDNPDPERKKYINDLYKMRSNILHLGYMLLRDSHSPGYYSYKELEEIERMSNLVTVVRKRLVDWLLNVHWNI